MIMNRPVGEPRTISRYTALAAENAVNNGVLIEVDPALRMEAGYRWPVRITQGVAALVTPEEEERSEGQSLEARLWDVLWLARVAISNGDPHETVAPFEVTLGQRSVPMCACLDTTSGPAIHIIRPEEY